MTHYIVDAYNVIGKCHQISLSDKDKEARLINLVEQFLEGKKDKVTLVFDGKRQHEHLRTRYQKNQVYVIFSACDESADDVIIELVKQKNKNRIIVSSDTEIRNQCKWNRGEGILAEDFVYLLENIKPHLSISEEEQRCEEKEIKYWLKLFS